MLKSRHIGPLRELHSRLAWAARQLIARAPASRQHGLPDWLQIISAEVGLHVE
jgi:hypothetical protein